jgi:hypothetical protein
MRHADAESQREDLLRLLALVEDPRTTAADLGTTERKWLRQAENRLNFDGVTLLDDATVRNARFTYRILLRGS